MKRLISFVVASIICIICFSSVVNAQAADDKIIYETDSYVIKLDGGYYAEVTVGESAGFTKEGARAVTEKYGYKEFIFRDNSGNKLWRFVVNGTFSVNTGVSATCTQASYRTEIFNNNWQEKTASATKSQNKAIGDATFIKKVLLITTNTEEVHLVLTCDKNGNMS